MLTLTPQLSLIFATLIFTSTVILHLIKKNSTAVQLYMFQSATIAILLILSSIEKFSILLLIAIVATIVVKIIVAPYFFFGIIKKHQVNASAGKYLNSPITLLVIVALVSLTKTNFFKPLVFLLPLEQNLLFISIASILVSIFLSINRKGAISQMIGILSLENSIVGFAIFAGLEQNPSLQLGITFNILIWIIIASVFASTIFKQFGSIDVSRMKKLTE